MTRPCCLVVSLFLNLQRFEPGDDIGTMAAGFHLFVDEGDQTPGIDIEGPALGKTFAIDDHAVSFSDLLVGITQDGVIKVQGFGEFGVDLDGVATRRKIRKVELLDILATLTE